MAKHVKGNDPRGTAGTTLQELYRAARAEVLADPAAALRKYQPQWEATLPPATPKPGRRR